MAKKILPYQKLKKIQQILKKQDNDKSKLALSLVEEAFFCGETLEKLKDEVEDTGVVTTMCQGDYYITRENPALRSYNTTLKSYQNLIKQIVELMADVPGDEDTDELKEFMSR